jgi:hypothetical protein
MCIEKYHPFKNWFGSTTGAKECGVIESVCESREKSEFRSTTMGAAESRD